jgi:hypothetical protein
MPTQHFDILIQAPRERVWITMLQSPTYEQWTSAFCEGSRFEGSWKQGDAIRFLDAFGGCEDMMARLWPPALDQLKRLCEGTN